MDDTSIIVINYNQGGLQTALNKTISDKISQFKVNFLLPKSNKTQCLEIRNKNSIDTTLDINYFNKSIANVPYTKFLCLLVDDTLTCDNHIDTLITRLNPTCYAIRDVKGMFSMKDLRIIQFSYVHIFYGIIVC